MARWLAGAFASSRDPDPSTLCAALRSIADEEVRFVRHGLLSVAYTGPPVAAEDTTLCLLDGFVDNPDEIRERLGIAAELSLEGLLAAAWRRVGPDFLPLLRGEFALVVWDEATRRGMIARDQLGVRPLFQRGDGGLLRFAGEIRPLLEMSERRPTPDPVSVAHWITMGQRPGAETLFEGVRRVPPGSMVLLDGASWRTRSYWSPVFREPLRTTGAELAGQVRSALRCSIARRLAAEGSTTGVLMSGGLDSASVAALAASTAPGAVIASAATFPDHPSVDESALIHQLRARHELAGITAEVRGGGLIASAVESIERWWLPLRSWGDFWALPLLSATGGLGATVTLGGDGGDELFGVRAMLLADRLRQGRPVDAVRLARELPGAGEAPRRREVLRVAAATAIPGAMPPGIHESLKRVLAQRRAPRWLRPDVVRALRDSDEPLAWKRLDGPRWWAETAHGLTRRVDEIGVFDHQRRRAASAGLEARHPMFDLDLVELGLRLPPEATFDRNLTRPLLRAAMQGLLPDSVRLRPAKAVFDAVLVESLLSLDGALVRDLLCDPGAELGAYVDLRALERTLFASPGGFHRMWQVWRLATAECWLRALAGRSPLPNRASASPSQVVIRQTTPVPA